MSVYTTLRTTLDTGAQIDTPVALWLLELGGSWGLIL